MRQIANLVTFINSFLLLERLAAPVVQWSRVWLPIHLPGYEFELSAEHYVRLTVTVVCNWSVRADFSLTPLPGDNMDMFW